MTSPRRRRWPHPPNQLGVVRYVEQGGTNRAMELVHGVVRLCRLIDARRQTIEAVDLQSMTPARLFQGEEPIRSYALPRGGFSANRIFA